jgi:zinc protease
VSGALASDRRVLANGLTLLSHRRTPTEAVSVGLSFAAGAAADPPGKEGLATLVARGLMRGTVSKDKLAIGTVLDDRGAHMGGSAGRHSAGLGARCRTADFEAIMSLLAECATTPTFPEAEVERLRGDRLTALREADDDPASVVGRSLREIIYGEEHPYGRRLRGTAGTIGSIVADDLRAHHARGFDPAGALLIVVGDLEPERVADAVGSAFDVAAPGRADAGNTVSGYRAALPRIADPAPLEGVVRRVVEMPDKAQADIALGHVALRRDDPRYYAVAVMNMVLGRFAMGGRLGQSVREEQGMAYYTYSTVEAGLGAGPFVVRAGVQAAHVDPAVDSIRAEIERMRAERVGEQELDDAKAAMIRSLPRTLESNEGIAGVLHQIEMFDLGVDYLDRFPGLIGQVDADAVQAAARSLLHPDNYALAIAGPYTES